MSIRSTERLTSIHRDTIMRLGLRIGAACTTLHDVTMRNLHVSQIQLDELWAFVGKKQRRVQPGEWDKGDLYTFLALDSVNKAILTYSTGRRDTYTTRMFIEDLRARVLGSPMVSSDGFQPYEQIIRSVFGEQIHYGQIVKRYVGEPPIDAARRYSPGIVVGVTRDSVIGFPPRHLISTSHVERVNLSVRMASRRFGRLTNGFSKKRRNHRAAVALFVAHYNFCRVHEALRTTPAVSIGIAERPWTIADLMERAVAIPPIPPSRQIGRFRVIDGGQS